MLNGDMVEVNGAILDQCRWLQSRLANDLYGDRPGEGKDLHALLAEPGAALGPPPRPLRATTTSTTKGDAYALARVAPGDVVERVRVVGDRAVLDPGLENVSIGVSGSAPTRRRAKNKSGRRDDTLVPRRSATRSSSTWRSTTGTTGSSSRRGASRCRARRSGRSCSTSSATGSAWTSTSARFWSSASRGACKLLLVITFVPFRKQSPSRGPYAW